MVEIKTSGAEWHHHPASGSVPQLHQVFIVNRMDAERVRLDESGITLSEEG